VTTSRARIWVRPDLSETFAGLGFADFLALGEHEVRVGQHGARRTAWFVRGGRRFFVKVHGGAGWGEIWKCWLQLKRPVVDARVEARALQRLAELAIPAPALAAYGTQGADPARRRSFVVTESLEASEDLAEWLRHQGPRLAPPLRARIARALGALAGRLHAARLGHQDLYLAHFRIRPGADGAFELFVIDLHRALPALPFARGWRRKDLAALRFSSLALGATRTDCARFLRAYGPERPARAERRRIETRARAVRARVAARHV
jgi:heptose I phosphotransferase